MNKQCKKVYILDNDNIEAVKGLGVELRASSRIMQGRKMISGKEMQVVLQLLAMKRRKSFSAMRGGVD